MKILIAMTALTLLACNTKSSRPDNVPMTLTAAEMRPLERLAKTDKVEMKDARLSILTFEDVRVDKAHVGESKNGRTKKSEPISLDISVPEYFKQRFTAGLSRRGINVVDNNVYGLRGKITKFWVTEQATGWSAQSSSCQLELQLEVVKVKNSQLVYQGTVSSEVSGTNAIVDQSESNGPVLETCVEFVLNKLVKDKNLEALMTGAPIKN